MELFPVQPDLSLQISPPNSKPASSWSRSDHETVLDLGFWRRAMDSAASSSSSIKNGTSPSTPKADTAGAFDLSLANPSVASNTNTTCSHLPHQYHFHPHHHQKFLHHDGCYHQDLGSIRPIRGIPVYYSPPSFSFLQNQLGQQHICDSSPTASSIPYAVQGMPRSTRFLPRFPAKRGMRAPRMRWTTTLHARFVHAVELLGGHESMKQQLVFFYYYVFLLSFVLFFLSFF